MRERIRIATMEAIQYFYTDRRITLTKQSGPYDDNLRILFAHLPSLFDFIQEHNVPSLDLSMVTDHGAYPIPAALVAPRLFTKGLPAIIEELRALLASNQTLTYCNLGLFADEFTRIELQAIFEGHPTIGMVCLTSTGATTHYHMPPNRMYRHPRGNLYWAHFRED